MLAPPMSTQTALCAILSMIASAWTPPPSLGCRSFFLNWVQKTVEAVPYPSSISSSSIDLNLVSGLSSSHYRPHDTHGGHRTASCRHFLLQYFEAGVWRGIWRLWRSRRQHDRWEVINLRALHRTYGCVCWLGGIYLDLLHSRGARWHGDANGAETL